MIYVTKIKDDNRKQVIKILSRYYPTISSSAIRSIVNRNWYIYFRYKNNKIVIATCEFLKCLEKGDYRPLCFKSFKTKLFLCEI